MHTTKRWSLTVLLATAIASPALIAGCSGHVRVYDSYYHDYHPWNSGEVTYYSRWETDTHRAHVDYNHRTPEDQHAYWDYRHSH